MMNRFPMALLISGFILFACQNPSDTTKKQDNAGRYSCVVQKNGALTVCTEYQGLSGTNLAAIQSECELKGASGYNWSLNGCPSTARIASCGLAKTPQRLSAATQYYFGPAFTADVASGMCAANEGAFTKL